MADIDDALRDAFHRLAEPGDPSGVAEAIRRAAAGGPGGSDGSGGSGGASGHGGLGLRPWLPWVGAALVCGAAGATAGAAGLFGAGEQESSLAALLDDGVVALACPAGSPVVTLEAGQRVLAMLRSEDGAYLAVRDPFDLERTVWLPTGIVVIDDGEPATDSLPVGGCPVPSVAPSVTPEPVVTEAPSPEPAPEPEKPKPDTTPPSISAGSFSPQPINQAGYGGYCANASASFVTVTVTDNRGIASVTGSTTFPGATVTLQSQSGSSFVFKFQMPSSLGSETSAAVSFTATDTSGNSSSTGSSVALEYCLI